MTDTRFKKYQKKQYALMRPYEPGESMDEIEVGVADQENGSPQIGDYIAQNPNNTNDQWLVSAKFFTENYVLMEGS